MANIQPGMEAPRFILPAADGTEVDLHSYRGKKNIVLYFYPKDQTPGCTKEACGFRDAFKQITKLGAVIIGVSLDSPESHQRFIQKYTLPFILVSDQDATVSKAYGVYKLKNMYGRKFWGIERSTFLIDSKGIVLQTFPRVKVDVHVDEIISALKKSSN